MPQTPDFTTIDALGQSFRAERRVWPTERAGNRLPHRPHDAICDLTCPQPG